MFKTDYFSNKFSKTSPLPSILVTWSCGSGQIVVFQTNYDEIKL